MAGRWNPAMDLLDDSRDPANESRSRPTTGSIPLVVAAIVLISYVFLASLIVLHAKFPYEFDELQHLSVIVAQREHPDPFADPSNYFVLSADDNTKWSAQRNYLAHPSLYYLLLAPLSGRQDANVVLLRFANVFMASAALLMTIVGGFKLFSASLDRGLFSILAACFPKGALLAGIINNDNLADLAGALVFLGIVEAPMALWWLTAGLALAGWSKLTALIALSCVVGVRQLGRIRNRRIPILSKENVILAIGALVGASPYLVSLFRSGHLVYVNQAHFGVPVENRPAMSFVEFGLYFLQRFALKWPAAEGALGLPASDALMIVLVGLTLAGVSGRRDIRSVTLPYVLAFAVTFAVHLWFGWRSFVEIGDLTVAQTRYYSVLWPGVAAALTGAAIRRSAATHRIAASAIVCFCLSFTILGSLVASAIKNAS
jgi:hypothetical protein